MRHYLLTIGNKELKCRLTAQSIVNLEKKLGGSVMNVLMQMGDNQIPSLEVLLVILQASLQSLEHGFTIEKVYDLYDEYTEDKTMMDLFQAIIEILKVSGFFKIEEEVQ